MLFNSYAFIFGFLPITLILFFLIGKRSQFLAAAWLTLASLAFYGWWNPNYLLLLLLSIGFNFQIGKQIALMKLRSSGWAKAVFILGVAVNLGLLGYYKYLGFLIGNLNHFVERPLPVPEIVLPLGISFFTFTQLAFLADAYQGHAKEFRPVHYVLFVTYFPHLIAGPVLHHKEMMSQFAKPAIYRINWENLAAGLSVFFIGLFKKLLLADEMAQYARPAFDAAAKGEVLGMLDAWGGALAYSFQLYFDFSAYSDMAVGISLLFGIKLPLNFDSPYKAASIIDFWRRWHMTLSRFLRDYLYIPLGGNRHGPFRRYLNLLVTMVLGGAWHGANWTYILWGGLHGLYLVVNHQWQGSVLRRWVTACVPEPVYHKIALLTTFLAVVVAWVFFRAENVDAARLLLEGMAGQHGVALPLKWRQGLGDAAETLARHGIEFRNTDTFNAAKAPLRILICLGIVWFLPNTQQVMARYRPALGMDMDVRGEAPQVWWQWRPSGVWLGFAVTAAALGILSLNEISEFIYFQF
ncbi:MBOAT family O-acyltransferase [Methylomicrobium sp. RS1]|uniref:MBOAT family O-acyltransferase n=1 Tax=Candidatus Methylomicrobium oryzae TaxID=2802053 RepID=UPI0019226FE4|nr:MBOAT family protein [Methylomicrobium sp. RS1]